METPPIYLDANITEGTAKTSDTIYVYCEHYKEDNDAIYAYIPFVLTCSICVLFSYKMARHERLLALTIMIARHQKINWKMMHLEYEGEALDENKTPAEMKWTSKQTYAPLVTIEFDIDNIVSSADEEELEVTTGKQS